MNRSTHVMDPCAKEAACECSPAEFVRLRYFFGQRLGVVDLSDEQAYLVGKHRFHNVRAHGVGVLCGLRAERYATAQGANAGATTLLRVRRGSALDPCGREIIVGWDQCIDVAAWYAQHQAPLPVASVAARDDRLWVALCYRECPSDPAPAPRDPCGCDAGGCEFARVREGFQLRIVTSEEARLMARRDGPRQAMLDDAFAHDLSAAEWQRLVTRLGAADCDEAVDDPCLLLASFKIELDAAGTKVVDISVPDNDIAERLTLLPTWLLQAALLRTLQAGGDAGTLADGPRWGDLSFAGAGADAGTLMIDIAGDDALARDPLVAPAQLTVSVSHYNDDGTWTAADPDTTTYAAGATAQLKLAWNAALVDGARYRLLIETDRAQPPVDTAMRPLAPPSWARHFRLVLDAGVLTLADTLYP